MEREIKRRSWMEIELDAILNIYEIARKHLKKETRLIAVVKADAYGCGAPQVARLLEEQEGVCAFGVASFDEGVRLRRAGIRKPILILGYTPPELAAELAEQQLTATLTDSEYARALSDCAVRAGVTVGCHVKLDTGMSRLGILGHPVERAVAEIAALFQLQGLAIGGIFTHFAASNWEDGSFNDYQFQNFVQVTEELRRQGLALPVAHCCNSGAVVFHPECDLGYVRFGFLLYGVQPDPARPVEGLREPIQLKTLVAQVKELAPGARIGYDCTFEVKQPMRIAVVPIGYADGLPYGLSNCGEMLVRGQRAPIVGKVCMDQTMLDVTHIPEVQRGDIVTVFGRDGREEISVMELAQKAGVFAPGFFCNLNARVPRIFLKNGEIAEYELPIARW